MQRLAAAETRELFERATGILSATPLEDASQFSAYLEHLCGLTLEDVQERVNVRVNMLLATATTQVRSLRPPSIYDVTQLWFDGFLFGAQMQAERGIVVRAQVDDFSAATVMVSAISEREGNESVMGQVGLDPKTIVEKVVDHIARGKGDIADPAIRGAILADGLACGSMLLARGQRFNAFVLSAREDAQLRSPICRLMAREQYDLPALAYLDPLMRTAPAVEQVLLAWWLRLGDALAALSEAGHAAALDTLAEQTISYSTPHAQSRDDAAIDCAAGLIGSTWQRVSAAAPTDPAVDVLCVSLQRQVRTAGAWGLPLVSDAFEAVAGALPDIAHDQALGVEEAQRLGEIVVAYKALVWVAACGVAQGTFSYGDRRSIPLPVDASEATASLLHASYQGAGVGDGEGMGKIVARERGSWLDLSDRSLRRVRDLSMRETDLEAVLVEAILNERTYALDHLAIVEMDSLGIERITLAPEHHEDGTYTTEVIVHFDRGSLYAMVVVDRETSAASIVCPWVDVAHAADRVLNLDGSVERGLRLLVLALWRDLVVGEVREQQYEIASEQRGKKGKKGTRRSVVRYLPRTVSSRRREEFERERSGDETTLRRVFKVGAFARMLPEGGNRSIKKTEYAEEIGMPISERETVVEPHWRGGTEEERLAAKEAEASDPQTREWRSWSALTLASLRIDRS